jgi:thiol:disulfide interchange protein DsbD
VIAGPSPQLAGDGRAEYDQEGSHRRTGSVRAAVARLSRGHVLMHAGPFTRHLAPVVLALAAAWAGFLDHPVSAAEARPAKKDSPAATRPKEATLSAKVVPAEAKPGDAVTLTVTAEVAPGWHIYAHSKTQPDDGPRVTQFDLFDTAGLVPRGDWTASPPPVEKKEPAFPTLPFVSYHEGEVSWSIPLAVPADAAPGKKAIRVQAGYQVCSDQNCSFPGQWTLPAAELTILAAAPKAAARDEKVAQAGAEPPVAASSLQPAKKDSSARIRPKAATLTASVEPKEGRSGAGVTFKVTAKLSPKWHIYTYAKNPAEPGPTWFDLFDPAGLAIMGDWKASKEPHKPDAQAKGAPPLDYFEDEVTWSIPLVVPPGSEPGKRTLRVQAGYMVCNESNCSIPGQWTLPDVEFTVLPGGMPAQPPSTCTNPAIQNLLAAGLDSTSSLDPPATTTAPSAESSKSDVERESEKGLLPFLLTCALGGLFALAMPCVWPMVPITVNFFVKQGQKKAGATTGLAIAYCLAIIGVFTAIGLLCSIFFGAASLSKLGNNPWLNFAVAGLFLAFGLSLLGLFEIRLPNFLLNASAQGEGKGGIVGVMFMALTLTITSFTCTFPVVGGLLVMAANGSRVYPIIGMATFAAVLALPFFLLALSPGLLAKVPKSGDWMNAVKVVGGLVEIGAAFKFLNTAETAWVVPSEATFNAFTVLAIWVVLALVCGIYLLGLFRTDHDHEAVKVGPGRMILGSAFLFLALFMAPALFGRPPQSKLWYMIVGLLPADAGDLRAPAGGGGEPRQVLAVSIDPKTAERQQTAEHGVVWGMSYEAALEKAKAENKPILIDFTGVNCANCRLMEQEVLPRPEVVQELQKFVTVQLYTDTVPIKSIDPEERLKLAEANLERELKLTNEATNPLYVILSPDETVLGAKGGKMPPETFVGLLRNARAKLEKSTKVARAVGG